MEYTYFSEREFERRCPFAQYLMSYAESFNRKGLKWEFNLAQQDEANANRYTATFGSPKNPGFILEVECVLNDSGQYERRVLKIVDSYPDSANDGY